MNIKNTNFNYYYLNLISLLLICGLFGVLSNQAQANIPTFPEPNNNQEINDFNNNIPLENTPIQNLPLENNLIQNIPLQNLPLMITGLPLSPGDLIKITIPGIGGEIFSGDYEVNLYGYLEIPFIEPLFVVGLDAQQIKNKLIEILLEQQFFKPELLKVSVQVLQFSPIQVTVTGEVFTPGRITINRDTDTITIVGDPTVPGDNPLERFLTTALKNVDGIKPTADVENIQIIRNGQPYKTVDLSGLFRGEPIEDIALIAGDYIIVPKLEEFQSKLVRPSPITPDQISIYVSNLTDPGSGTSVSVSAETQNSSFQYGTRFAQALISAQCVGGNFRNENRQVLLIRTDSQTGEAQANQYEIKQVFAQPQTNPEMNPFIMPNDSIVCYDSELVNTETLFNLIGTFLNPLTILNGLFGIFN